MKILIACEFSGIVRDAFIAKGHDAVSCDLLPSESDRGRHYQCDVLELIDLTNFDMMIAHPPCTYLSNAGACRLYPTKGNIDTARYKKGLKAKDFFLKLYNSSIKKVCIENPVSSKVFNMPEHTQEIQPYQFGHTVSKKTRLWLKNLPPLIPTDIVEKEGTYLPSGTSRYKGTEKNSNTASPGKGRSLTFQGIANAMADQWG